MHNTTEPGGAENARRNNSAERMTNDWKKRLGTVYSTDPDFEYETERNDEPETLPAARQELRVWLDRRQRGGKTVTLVRGFVGHDDDLQELGRMLRSRCGTGGAVKEGEILVQGDRRDRVVELLVAAGYTKTRKAGS